MPTALTSTIRRGELTPSTISKPLVLATTTTSDGSFLVRFGGLDYQCRHKLLAGSGHYDCYRSLGGSTFSLGAPDLYCSGSRSAPSCSEDWYPDELAGYDFVIIGGARYVCRRPTLGGGIRDKECARYSGGDPGRVSFFNALKCTPDPVSYKCDTKYYPSEMKGLTIQTIGGGEYVCESTIQGNECYRWHGVGSPRAATYGLPDLYCNRSGACRPNSYP